MNNAFALTTKRIINSFNYDTSRSFQHLSHSPVSTIFRWGCHNGHRNFMTHGLGVLSRSRCSTGVTISSNATLRVAAQQHCAFATHAKGTKKRKTPEPQTSSSKIKRLRPAEIANVFGRLVDVGFGNDLLRVLQGQRISGTLDQEVKKPGVTPDLVNRGLDYLRENYPVDEDAAIRRRIEQENETMEEAALNEIEEAKKWQPQQSAKEDGVYGKSKVEEAVKHYNESRKKLAQAREEYLQRRRDNTEIVYEEELEKVGPRVMRKVTEVHIIKVGNTKIRKVMNTSYAPLEKMIQEQIEELRHDSEKPGLIKVVDGRYSIRRLHDQSKGEEKWWHKYEKQAQLTDWDGVSEPPYMSLSRRWGLPTLFMLLTVGASMLFAGAYQPPTPGARLFPDVPPAAATILGLMSVNFVAWLMWKVPPMWRTMNKNMLLHAVIPRPIQLLGSTFSHQQFSHLAMNMALLWFVGTSLCDQIGRGNFLALYIGGGVFASWLSLTHLVFTKQFLQASLGASGAVCAILACYLYMNAGRPIEWALFPGNWKPSLQAEHLLALVIFIDLIGAFYFLRSQTGSFDHFSHLGGYLAGIGTAQMLKKRIQSRRQAIYQQRPLHR